MKKADLLEAYLAKAIPGLKDKGENLFVFLDEGHLKPINGALSHLKIAIVSVVITELPKSQLLALDMALLTWCARNEPGLLRSPQAEKGFPFNIEMLDRNTCDVAFKIELSQLISIIEQPGGKIQVLERDEPDPDPGWEHLGGFKTDAHLRQLYLGEDLIAELPSP
ncbi:phage tail protein [Caulobacter segnis]|uniref:Phage tail protein n=1 Tax=Caulobacter segnis TaxID=88688 RepID=A0A2W5X812_9CAUL|nr:phage tail protein [Caulobacter segnis]PZR37174.1 MAG: hypothetical protein DI526_01270 [Caulobacter segnis]